MRTKILLGLFALVIGFFLWCIHGNLKSITQQSDNLNNRIKTTKGTINEKMPSSPNPLEAVYNRLILGMERQEALNIVDEEYPINDNAKFYSVGRNANGAYVWRWEWKNEIDSSTTESATLTITFTREGDCVICRVGDAFYAHERDGKKETKSLSDKTKKL